ncbi:MAG: hypothetical protein IT308_02625 [Anaerolineaceae bacterium]|nr:hypothetical protein [Anaerolineaceae bacterium]
MKFLRVFGWTGAAAWLLSACAGFLPSPTEIPPTPTEPPPSAATSTIVWFPATDTPRPVVTPSVQPSRDLHPGVDEQIFDDPFTSDSAWQTARGGEASIAYGNNELTLAIRQPKVSLASMNSELFLSDFYLEVTANPSLCRGEDVYGLLLRAATSSDGYRWLFSCNGQIRLERLKNGKITVLQDWVYSGQAPPGSPSLLRLGVWALRDELRFFVNDFYQFSASDALWRSGGLGFFARSAGNTALTVNFTNLKVYSLNPADVPPTETPTITPTLTTTATRIAPKPTYIVQ